MIYLQKNFPFLELLTLSNNKITGKGLLTLTHGNLYNLRILDISNNVNIQAKMLLEMKQ